MNGRPEWVEVAKAAAAAALFCPLVYLGLVLGLSFA